SPALPLSAYSGVYANDYFGRVEIIEQGSGLALQLGPDKQAFPLKHWDRDVFVFESAPGQPGALSGVTFLVGPDGKAQQVSIEAVNEPDQSVFTRLPAGK